MQTSRRKMIAMSSAAAAALATRALSGQVTPQPLPSPNAPLNQNVPAGLDGADIPVRNGRRVIPPATWLEIKSDAQKLLDLVADFKKRVDETNMGSTLPLPLIEEAHRIEKMAKNIQKRMKG